MQCNRGSRSSSTGRSRGGPTGSLQAHQQHRALGAVHHGIPGGSMVSQRGLPAAGFGS